MVLIETYVRWEVGSNGTQLHRTGSWVGSGHKMTGVGIRFDLDTG